MLKGKTAIVTGSTRGIGLAIARRFAASGANVILNGFGAAEEVERVRADLEASYDVRVCYSNADLRKLEDIRQLVSRTVSECGSLDILINNAGIQHTAALEAFDPARWDDVISTNLSAPFYLAHLALPEMRKRKWGRIVNIASVHGLVASVNKAAYVSAKHGLLGLTKVIALETAGSGITCNAICPGWTRTELIEPQISKRAEDLAVSLEEGARALVSEKQPSGQFVKAEDLAELAVFLTSDSAAQITGTAIPVDGGWTAQ